MNLYRAGETYVGEFFTSNPATGAAADADELPVAVASVNGTDDAAFVLTVTKKATGHYKVTGTVPEGYAAGDRVAVHVAATVNAVAGKAVVDSFIVAAGDIAKLAVNDKGYVTTDRYNPIYPEAARD